MVFRGLRLQNLLVVCCSLFLMAASVPEPIVSLPLERSERVGLHVRTYSSEGVPLRVVFDTAAANSILFDHEGTVKVSRTLGRDLSEERRVGKECRSRGSPCL